MIDMSSEPQVFLLKYQMLYDYYYARSASHPENDKDTVTATLASQNILTDLLLLRSLN